MKRILFAITIALFVVACSGPADGFTINGTIEGGVADGTKIYLKTSSDNRTLIEVDTVTVTNGTFTFSGETPKTLDPHYIFMENARPYALVFIEDGTMTFTAHKDSLMNGETVGTFQNDLFSEFKIKSNEIRNKVNSINMELRKASQVRDTATAMALRDEMKEIQEEAKSNELNFVKENPNSAIAPLILNGMYSGRALEAGEILELLNSMSDEVKQMGTYKTLHSTLAALKTTAIGSKAPEFSAPTPTGEKLALSETLGKVTILDFWAAWCKPCRMENPNIVNVYNKYHDKGLNILGVSFDRNADDWKKAIEEDGLTWNHVSNVKYFDEIAKLYNLNSIPATFILDEKGVIIAKNLRGKQLEDKIAELLN